MAQAKSKAGRPKDEENVNVHYRLPRSLVLRVRTLAKDEKRPASRQVELLLERALA